MTYFLKTISSTGRPLKTLRGGFSGKCLYCKTDQENKVNHRLHDMISTPGDKYSRIPSCVEVGSGRAWAEPTRPGRGLVWGVEQSDVSLGGEGSREPFFGHLALAQSRSSGGPCIPKSVATTRMTAVPSTPEFPSIRNKLFPD